MKDPLRAFYKELRLAINSERRLEAEREAATQLYELSKAYPYILSYQSFGSELSMRQLNSKLASEKRLVLPRVDGEHIQLYFVNELSSLVKSPLGVPEPSPELHEECDVTEVPLALVPGLSFDAAHHRLGYGKGYYDRFLARHPDIKTVGVGFKEQRAPKPLPTHSGDRSLDLLLLF